MNSGNNLQFELNIFKGSPNMFIDFYSYSEAYQESLYAMTEIYVEYWVPWE